MTGVSRKPLIARLALLAAMLILSPSSVMALTASEVFDRGKAKITGAKTLQADFIMKMNGRQISGKIFSKGNRFALISSLTSSWFNGTSLYTYDAGAGETFLSTPTLAELREVNPLLFLSSAQDYKITASKKKKTDIETVVLLPKRNGGAIKSVTIELDSKTFLPKSVKITPSTGTAVDITISNVRLNAEISNSTFEYPKSKYQNVTVIDMR